MERVTVLTKKALTELDIGAAADPAYIERNTVFCIDLIYAVFINLIRHPYGIDMRI